AGNAKPMDFLLLLRGDFALEPDKALASRQAFAHLASVEIGQRAAQQFDRLVLVDDATRLAEQARRLDVGGEDFAVAIDDIRPRGGIMRGGAMGAAAIDTGCEHHQPSADHGIGSDESQDHEANAGAGLRRAIDIAAVKEAANQPLVPGALLRVFGNHAFAHGLPPCAGTEPVAAGASVLASMVSSMEPIG